jgi:hypothetical protein
MSAKDREIEYLLKLKDEATAVWNKFSGGVAKGTGDMRSMMGGLGAAIGGAFTVAAAKSFIEAANDAEMQVAKLDQALKNNGVTSGESRAAMLDYSEALSAITTYDDDVITGLQATALTMTGNMNAVQPLTKASLNLASATGMSAEAAMKMFTKSVEGAEGLKKLGITIGATSSENERLEKTMAAVEKKFGGFAENEAKTGAGALKQLGNAVGNLEESLGAILKDILIPIMPALQAVIGLISKAVPILISGLKGLFAELYSVVLSPLALIEKGLNLIGVTESKFFQGLEDSADKLASKYKNEFVAGFSAADKAVIQSTEKVVVHSAAVESLRDRLKRLKDELEKLSPGTAAYGAKLQEITRIEDQFKLATERAELALKGLSGVTTDDTFFLTRMAGKISTMKTDIDDVVGSAMKMIKKDFGGAVDPDEQKQVEDQAAIYAEIRMKSFASEKEEELFVIDEWEQKAINMAGDSESMITDIRRIAAGERAQIELDAAQRTFESIAGFAQRGVQTISKFISQNSQAQIISIEKAKEKEIRAIDAEREASQAKYDALLENEALTAEEKSAIKKQAEEEDAKILARKAATEAEFNARLAEQKTAAFNAEKHASAIEAIINTAVEVSKVLATPWMIPIVAALGAAQVALIESQPTPKFHSGGSGYFNAPASSEATVKVRGGETIDVYTPEQRDEANRSKGNTVNLTMNFNSPVSDVQWVRKAVIAGIKQTGLTVDRLLVNQTGSVTLAQ